MIKRKLISFFMLAASIALLSACAIQYPTSGIKQGKIRTQLSNSVTLGLPVAKVRTITVQVVDLAHQPKFCQQLKTSIIAELKRRDFKVLPSQQGSNFVLSAKVKRAGVMGASDAEDILVQGYNGKVKPAGEIALGAKDYYDMAVKSKLVYAVVIDMAIFANPDSSIYDKAPSASPDSGWYKYQTRIVSRYSEYFMPSKFASVSSRFAHSIAKAISVMF